MKQPKPKKCKICKQPFKPTFSTAQAVCSPRCAITLTRMNEEKKRAKEDKEKRKELRERKKAANPKKQKAYLQDEINKLARKIDEHFSYNCIDCDKRLEYGKARAVNAAHFHNVGNNETLRFNLHNIHSATMWCNCYNTDHKTGYREKLEKRYGSTYFDYVVNRLPIEYQHIGLNSKEIDEALKTVRKLNREFEQHTKGNDVDGSMLREYFNQLIGIYK